MKLRLTFILSLLLLVACGGPGERIKDIESQKPSPTPSPGERAISGTFNVAGAFTNDADPYTGILNITPRGEVYGFRWTLSRGNRVGTGVQIGNATAASFAPTGGGKGCGVVLFRIASDGSLDGRIAYWGEEKASTIKATRSEGRGFAGKYSIVGRSRDGLSGFAGNMSVTKDGGGYALEWVQDYERGGDETIVAFGIWKGSVAAASFAEGNAVLRFTISNRTEISKAIGAGKK